VLPDPGVDEGGSITIACVTSVKTESTNVAEPMFPPLPFESSRKPTSALVTVMLFQTQPQPQMIWTAVLQPLNVSRWTVNCWFPPSG
jgi:hypothetical protein